MATTNFLDFVGNPEIENKAVACIAKYAVGTCGPRGFYGTTDVHLLLESTIARFCNSEKSIVYSYGFSTISSAIASYCKKQDIIFADEGVVLPIQMGILASRSKVYWFKHNNLEHLKTLLESVELQEKEGLYQNYSDIPDLKQIINLKYAYKARIIIDESLSIGTLGRSGRGIPNDIDLRSFSFENAFASVGGACVGAEFIIDHQRLAGLAYCFSASSPTFLCRVVIDEIEMLENDNERVSKLQKLSRLFFDKIRNKLNPDMEVFGSEYSPIFHIRLSKYFHDVKRESHRRILENFYVLRILKKRNTYALTQG
ncbi:Serine palmitoyltransferase 1 [Thelohanellus kitauei]|uniref:Serine palmitoyltransferase 1 n=1 Tax=Thelohanellus kitauei TaxID=669202 RepID=A0A0C2NEK4_THEKT|nr:Serine palmitoyltransferase 1 [Thelohanellus kitauei]